MSAAASNTSGDTSSDVSGVIPNELAGTRVDAGLARLIPELSRERIKALIADGHVTLDQRPVTRVSEALAAGAAFQIAVPPPEPSTTDAEDIPLSIVFEDEHLIVIDKPAGLVVHPAAGHSGGTLVNALLHHCAGQLSGIGGVERPGIVHRIDKDTSGLLVVAKTDQAHAGLAVQFADHSITRSYAAIVHGHPRPGSGTITGNIGRSERDRKKMALVAANKGKHAVTHYKMIEPLKNSALIECRLETGRTHQVRVHMASIGHALLGDPLYCRSEKSLASTLKALAFRRQALHAKELGFIHPASRESCVFFSPVPDDMTELLAALRV